MFSLDKSQQLLFVSRLLAQADDAHKDAHETMKNAIAMVGIRFQEHPGPGIVVIEAPEHLPGYQSGVREGDVILRVSEKEIDLKQDFLDALHGLFPVVHMHTFHSRLSRRFFFF